MFSTKLLLRPYGVVIYSAHRALGCPPNVYRLRPRHGKISVFGLSQVRRPDRHGPRNRSLLSAILLGSMGLGGGLCLNWNDKTFLDSPPYLDSFSGKRAHPKKATYAGIGFNEKLRVYSPLGDADATEKLRAEQNYIEVPASNQRSPTSCYVTRLASNHPVEDMLSFHILDVGESNEWLFWAVYDGHAGWTLSTLLKDNLALSVAEELSKTAPRTDLSAVDQSIKTAFVKVDNSIMSDGIKAMSGSDCHATAISRIAPARAGSCALMAIFDPVEKNLRVANTGDSRAVLGRKVSDLVDTDTSKGSKWVAQALSTDHTGFNEKERERIANLHPDEPDIIDLKTGRLLGFAITRAFGDHRLKWPLKEVERCQTDFYGSSPRPNYKTPPYATAEPEVTTTKIQDGDFLILATDGFWDHVSTEHAVECVSMWINKTAKRDDLPLGNNENKTEQDTTSKIGKQSRQFDPSNGKEGKTGASSKDELSTTNEAPRKLGFPLEFKSTPSDFVVEDDNVATHLVRNALGGSRRELFSSVMTLQPPESRYVRDDITIQVIFFGHRDIPCQ